MINIIVSLFMTLFLGVGVVSEDGNTDEQITNIDDPLAGNTYELDLDDDPMDIEFNDDGTLLAYDGTEVINGNYELTDEFIHLRFEVTQYDMSASFELHSEDLQADVIEGVVDNAQMTTVQSGKEVTENVETPSDFTFTLSKKDAVVDRGSEIAVKMTLIVDNPLIGNEYELIIDGMGINSFLTFEDDGTITIAGQHAGDYRTSEEIIYIYLEEGTGEEETYIELTFDDFSYDEINDTINDYNQVNPDTRVKNESANEAMTGVPYTLILIE